MDASSTIASLHYNLIAWFFFILTKILNVIFGIIGAIMPFPINVHTLPFGADGFLTQGVAYVKWLGVYVPTIQIFLTAYTIYFTFRVGLMFLRLIRVIK